MPSDDAALAPNWRSVLLVDALVGVAVAIVGVVVIARGGLVLGSGLCALGLFYASLVGRRWRRWRQLRSEAGL